MTYTVILDVLGYYARFPSGEAVGPYRTVADLEHDMESLQQRLASGCFGDAK